MAKKILLIVEGDSDEVSFYRRLFSTCFSHTDYRIYSYRTTIHILAQELFTNYPDFDQDSIDIKLVLSSLSNDHNKELLLENYTDTFLIFDFDPHHDHVHFDTVRRMLCYFNDSTVQGKLFINYPMMQSYKHFSVLPDPSFKSRIVDYSDIKNYKKVVGAESNFTDVTRYDYRIFYSLAMHHIMKANYLLSGNYEMPTEEEYQQMNLVDLYDLELNMYQNDFHVSVINTCIFQLCDFAPAKFFSFIQHRRDEPTFP